MGLSIMEEMSGEEEGCCEEGMVTLVWMVREAFPGLSKGESRELRLEWARGTSLCQELSEERSRQMEQQVQRLRGGQMSLVQKQYHCSWRRVNSCFSSSYYFNFCKIIMIIAANVYLVFTL